MAYEQRDNSGTIFKNDRKEKETHPDRTGTAMIDGVEYYISGWLKSGARGQFLSLSFKRKQQDHVNQSTEQSISNRAQASIRKPDPISTGRHPNGYSGRDLDDDSEIPF
jgi:hypothetical protein